MNFATIKKIVKDCLTENDGVSYCPFRVGGAVLSASGIPTFIGCTIFTVYQTHHFDMMAFGTGFATIFGGMAALAGGVAYKSRFDTPCNRDGS